MITSNRTSKAFTLIELSIVLVIIGLIVGGVLVGRDLIAAAAVRAQITQLEKYQTAVNTFRGKYNGIPGDLNTVDAQNFGLFALAPQFGNGNGILESGNAGCNVPGQTNCLYGEFVLFWIHLSQTNLIDAYFPANFSLIDGSGHCIACTNVAALNKVIPAAAIGRSTSVTDNSNNGLNYFTIAGFKSAGNTNGYYGVQAADNTLYAKEAYAIDSKIDDGLPHVGSVLAIDTNQDISSNLFFWVTVSGNANCATGGTSYALSATTPACSLSVRFR